MPLWLNAGAPIPKIARRASHVERATAWHNAFNRLQRCYERHEDVINASFGLADTIITVRSLIRQAWITYRWGYPARASTMITPPICASS